MSEAVVFKLYVVLALLLAGGVTAVAVSLFHRLVWWPALLLQTRYRPGLVFLRLVSMLGLTAAGALLIFPTGLDVGVMILLWLTVVPGLTERWVRAAAWRRDTPKDRKEAAAIRRSIRLRRSQSPALDTKRPWPEYIVDKARFDRRAEYRPPGD